MLALVSFFLFSFTGEGWKTVYTKQNVVIKSKQADCNLDNAFKQRWFLLSFTNNSAGSIKVQWNLEQYDENKKCVTCDDGYGEHKYSLTLAPGETKEGFCSFSCPTELRVVSKILDIETSMSYPDFKITDVKVSTVK